jgi:hypothetical protein
MFNHQIDRKDARNQTIKQFIDELPNGKCIMIESLYVESLLKFVYGGIDGAFLYRPRMATGLPAESHAAEAQGMKQQPGDGGHQLMHAAANKAMLCRFLVSCHLPASFLGYRIYSCY